MDMAEGIENPERQDSEKKVLAAQSGRAARTIGMEKHHDRSGRRNSTRSARAPAMCRSMGKRMHGRGFTDPVGRSPDCTPGVPTTGGERWKRHHRGKDPPHRTVRGLDEVCRDSGSGRAQRVDRSRPRTMPARVRHAGRCLPDSRHRRRMGRRHTERRRRTRSMERRK